MEKQQRKRSTLSWVAEFAGQKRPNYILSVLLAMIKVVCGIMPYVYMADIVDKLLKMHSGALEKDMSLLTASIVKMAVFWLICRICHAISTTLSHAATFEVFANIRRQLTEKLSKLPLGSVLSQSSGTYKNIICERVDSIETTLAHIIPEVLSNAFVPVALIIYMMTINWKLTLISLVCVPVGTAFFMLMMVGGQESYNNCVTKTKRLNDTAVEYINGIEVIKAFGKSKTSYEKFVIAAKEGADCFIDWMRRCNLWQNILTTFVITVFVYIFDWRIGLLLTAGIAVYALVNAAMQKKTRRGAPIQQKANRDLVAAVIELIQGIAEVKNYNLVSSRAKKLEKAIKAKQNGDTHLEFDVIPYITLQEIVTKLTGVLMCALSVYFYINGSMSLLYCIMMMISSFMIYESLDIMAGFSALIRSVAVCVEQASEILSIPEMDINGDDITPASHDIELKNVTFAYENKTIINGVDLKIPERTTTAIVGPSGGGKTTLTNLMARFWDVQSGEVLLGGRNVKDYSFDSLMRNFSFVFQRVYLFEDTIANNIRFGEPDAPMEKVIEAAKKARCHDFIMSLPEGYDTVIGEGGASLSGGEKQRISIARAIMKDSPVIILDEATANVDPENEAELTKAIEELTKEKTIIMIAHRLKTVEHADQIVVIDDGRIVQQGKHAELMQQDGIYRTFVEDRKKAVSWKL